MMIFYLPKYRFLTLATHDVASNPQGNFEAFY